MGIGHTEEFPRPEFGEFTPGQPVERTIERIIEYLKNVNRIQSEQTADKRSDFGEVELLARRFSFFLTGKTGIAFSPTVTGTHATSHQAGGADSIKLDNLATPDDNTDLNFSTSLHGLVPKGTNVGDFLEDDGTWSTISTHTQNTDTALGSGAVSKDHGTAATDQIVNICYGTGSPPTANTTTIGTLFVKYTA